MVLPYYLRNFLKPEIYGPGYRGMIKQGFYESPYITVSMIGFPFVFLLLPYPIYKYHKLGGDKRRFMPTYTIIRPDDKRRDMFFKFIDRTKPDEPK